MARAARVETERADALDAKVGTTLSSMAERAERAAAAAPSGEGARARFFAGRAASEATSAALPRRRVVVVVVGRRPLGRVVVVVVVSEHRRRRGRVAADARGEARVDVPRARAAAASSRSRIATWGSAGGDDKRDARDSAKVVCGGSSR